MGNAVVSVEDCLFELKFTAKQLVRESIRLEKKEKEDILKMKLAMAKGNLDNARIYGENAIRSKTQAKSFLQLSARVDAVASRVETAVRMQQVTKAMAGVTHGMEQTLKTMDLEKISNLLDRFDKTFEDLDVQAMTMEQRMGNVSAQMIPSEEVDKLMQRVAEEHGLEVRERLDDAAVPSGAVVVIVDAAKKDQDELNAKLQMLRK